jgi:hypothetical protein
MERAGCRLGVYQLEMDTDDLRVSEDTTTMQVVQQTLVCASAAKWIDAFRSRGTGSRPSATIGHPQRSMWQEQATPKRSRTIWLGAY